MLALFAAVLSPALALDPGTVTGTLSVDGKPVPLKYAYAQAHDNAEGLLDKDHVLRILLTDRAVSQSVLAGIAFLPVSELAMQGKVQGLLFETAPTANPQSVVVTLLQQPKEKGHSLMTQTISVTGKKLFSNWQYNSQRVVGAIEENRKGISDFSDHPSIQYSVHFSAPVFREPAVTADLKGETARNSPQVRLLAARVAAMKAGDFVALRKLSTERSNRQLDMVLSLQGDEVKTLLKQGAAEMEKSLPKVLRVVVRGNRAVVLLPDKSWANLVREGETWKSDD